LRHETNQLRHHKGDEHDDQARARQREERRIDQRLLHAIAQIFRLGQMLDQPRQNIRQRAARLARRD
jgi:hypothetical protein